MDPSIALWLTAAKKPYVGECFAIVALSVSSPRPERDSFYDFVQFVPFYQIFFFFELENFNVGMNPANDMIMGIKRQLLMLSPHVTLFYLF